VITTTHVGHLDETVGHRTGALEIIRKPYDLDEISRAVPEANHCLIANPKAR
jgi:hypothetical protein